MLFDSRRWGCWLCFPMRGRPTHLLNRRSALNAGKTEFRQEISLFDFKVKAFPGELLVHFYFERKHWKSFWCNSIPLTAQWTGFPNKECGCCCKQTEKKQSCKASAAGSGMCASPPLIHSSVKPTHSPGRE